MRYLIHDPSAGSIDELPSFQTRSGLVVTFIICNYPSLFEPLLGLGVEQQGEGEDRMKRIAVMLIAALVIVGLPAAAVAQVDEEAVAAAKLLKEKADAVGGADAAAFEDGFAEVEAALADLKAIAPGLDYAELDAAIADLRTAIDGGDVSEMEAAAAAVAAAAAGVEAEAEAEAGAGAAGVDSGGAVTSSPNVALLGLAAILLLLAGGALAVRRSIARR